MRILALVTDAYGGYGGVAAYSRHVLDALAADPAVREIVTLPRAFSSPIGAVPQKVSFQTCAAGGAGAYLKTLLKSLATGKYDLVYCAHINLAPLACLAAKLARAPWIMTIYGIDAWKPPGRRSAIFAARDADHVMALSGVTLKRFLSWCPVSEERTSVMHNAIHLEQFGMKPRNEALAERLGLRGRKIVMTLGRMDPLEKYKGFDEVMSLLPRLAEHIPKISYVLAGDGADRARLEAKAAELGVADRTVFTGFIPEHEKADLYRLADVYAMPSYGEGFGFVLIEAMACGVPTIASREDGGREAVREGMIGRLVDPHNPDDVEQAILAAFREEKHIPDGLSYFSFPNFTTRMRALAHTVSSAAKAG
jgi:glycosyltransferase involved in cell wall biosynthesis